MEKTYLDREELIHNRPVMRNPDQPSKEDYNAGWNACVRTFIDIIKEQPAADVEPVKHGKWICMGDCGVTKCSYCGWTIEEYIEDKYCRECGARMDGDAFKKGM